MRRDGREVVTRVDVFVAQTITERASEEPGEVLRALFSVHLQQFQSHRIGRVSTKLDLPASHIPTMGMSAVMGLRLSCIAFTEPFEVAVVETAHSAPTGCQKHSSLGAHLRASRWPAAAESF